MTNKIKRATTLGITASLERFAETISQEELLAAIANLNNDKTVDGMIVQLPLPAHINKLAVLEAVAPHKDVDGFHPLNIGYLHAGINNGFTPCTPLGCLHLLRLYIEDLRGKHAVIIGCSDIVGKPMAALLLQERCTITICHSQTQNLAAITKMADIVVTATGTPLFLTREYFNPATTVIDVGITRLPSNKIVGDVDFENVAPYVANITPVPGGVGPMTIAYLLANTLKAAEQNFII